MNKYFLMKKDEYSRLPCSVYGKKGQLIPRQNRNFIKEEKLFPIVLKKSSNFFKTKKEAKEASIKFDGKFKIFTSDATYDEMREIKYSLDYKKDRKPFKPKVKNGKVKLYPVIKDLEIMDDRTLYDFTYIDGLFCVTKKDSMEESENSCHRIYQWGSNYKFWNLPTIIKNQIRDSLESFDIEADKLIGCYDGLAYIESEDRAFEYID